MSSETRKKMGRPCKYTTPVLMRFLPEEIEAIDLKATQMGANRQAAVKSLLDIALYHVETAQHQR